jgi:hypothetical protein
LPIAFAGAELAASQKREKCHVIDEDHAASADSVALLVTVSGVEQVQAYYRQQYQSYNQQRYNLGYNQRRYNQRMYNQQYVQRRYNDQQYNRDHH